MRSVLISRSIDWIGGAIVSTVPLIRVQDQIDTDSPMGRAMFTIIGAMAELESSLISERVTAGMRAAEARGRHLGRPGTQQHVVNEIEALATSTDLSIRAGTNERPIFVA
jgi:DNA invertase Pin-like site-specific DNA recombinase